MLVILYLNVRVSVQSEELELLRQPLDNGVGVHPVCVVLPNNMDGKVQVKKHPKHDMDGLLD